MVKPLDIELDEFWKDTDYSKPDVLDRMILRMDLNKTLGGTKHDSGKPDLSLVPQVLLNAVAQALQFGEGKYGRYNYLKGFDSHRLVAACMRHIAAYQDGEDLDPESNLPHLAHAAACIAMMLHCEKVGTLKDTRFKG